MEKAPKNDLYHVTGIGLDTLETSQTPPHSGAPNERLNKWIQIDPNRSIGYQNGTQMEPKWNPNGTHRNAVASALDGARGTSPKSHPGDNRAGRCYHSYMRSARPPVCLFPVKRSGLPWDAEGALKFTLEFCAFCRGSYLRSEIFHCIF